MMCCVVCVVFCGCIVVRLGVWSGWVGVVLVCWYDM